jgi:hypothetical protein
LDTASRIAEAAKEKMVKMSTSAQTNHLHHKQLLI